jgi:hypothetical protein
MITRISSSLISYQNGRKKVLIIAGNNRESVNEYATVRIDLRAYEILIPADPGVPVHRATGRSVLLMSTESDAAIGRLAVMDGTLNDLLRDLAGEITGQDAAGMTTGKPPRPCPGRPKATAR